MLKRSNGFTLIEVMLVMVIIGLIVSAIVPNITRDSVADVLEEKTRLFQQRFYLASEYALLNNIELGLYVEENTYQFLGFDGVRWVPVPDVEGFTSEIFDEPFFISLELDDLPVDEQMMLDNSAYEEYADEQGVDEEEGEEEPVYPQIYILSGGDITPFKLTLGYDDDFDTPVMFEVTGLYTIPLEVEGPIYDEIR